MIQLKIIRRRFGTKGRLALPISAAYPDFCRLYIWAFDVPSDDGSTKEDLFYLSEDGGTSWRRVSQLPEGLTYTRADIRFPKDLWYLNFNSPNMVIDEERRSLCPDVDGQAVLIVPDNPNIKPLSVPPGWTMIPLRFVSESLGCEVEWLGKTKEILITSY